MPAELDPANRRRGMNGAGQKKPRTRDAAIPVRVDRNPAGSGKGCQAIWTGMEPFPQKRRPLGTSALLGECRLRSARIAYHFRALIGNRRGLDPPRVCPPIGSRLKLRGDFRHPSAIGHCDSDLILR